jgi:CubicO group peptidase (beta-lactamase class C family)
MPVSRLATLTVLALAWVAADACAQSAAGREQALRSSVNIVNWDDGGDISRFVYLNSSEVFASAIVRRGGPARELPERPVPEVGRYALDDAGKRTLERFIDEELDGFLILHRGAVAYERYPRMKSSDRHLSFSVTKAFVGMALAILEDQGRVDIAKGIETYVPRMKGTAWEGIPIRDLMEMAAGIEGSEDSVAAYSDPKHKHFLMEAALAWQPRTQDMPESVRTGDAYAFVATLGRLREPGKVRDYSSIQTIVLAEALERITGKRLAEALGDLIWSRMGAEGDAVFLVNERGQPVAHSGLCLRLRDLARFGLLFTATGAKDAAPVMTPSIIKRVLENGRPELLKPGHADWVRHANYQWDSVGRKGELSKAGFGGQIVFVDRERDVVIAMFATNAKLDSPFPELPLRALAERYFGVTKQ